MESSWFFDTYKEYLQRYVLKGEGDEVLLNLQENLVKNIDRSIAEPANILDVHMQAFREILRIRDENEKVDWIYIQRATEFLLQALVITDVFIKVLEEDLEKDVLTHVYNRFACYRLLKQFSLKAETENFPFSLAFLDIDDFKKINDTFGHEVGDKVLKEVTQIIKRSAREKDEIIRYGGEEFLILLWGVNKEQAKVPLERIRKNIDNTSFTEKGLHVTVTIGVSGFFEDRPEKVEDLIKFADMAMYRGKREGKNRVVVYDPIINGK